MAAKKTPATSSNTPGLPDLAAWFGADRWDRLEKQAATVRNWTVEDFHREALALLEVAAVTHKAAHVVRVAACSLLCKLGSAPTADDCTRTTPYAAPKAAA